MENIFAEYVFLIMIILLLVMLAGKMKIAYPIVLVLGGLALSFTSWFSGISINPASVFFIFLPPLLYEAAWQTSWKDLWKWRRVITSFAFPIVIITSTVIAFISAWLIPGFTLALGFLLGGIISPPDAVSATTIMRQVKVPRSLQSIIEGESLLNDASSLIVFRFALITVVTGQFHMGEAAVNFVLVITMGILIGLAVGFLFYCIHRWLPTTSSIEIVLTLVTPYCMYYVAEYFHFSGVLAVVSGGLLLSGKRRIMLSYRSRIEGVNVWTNLVFVLNGLVFFLIGLELPTITRQLEDGGLVTAIGYGLAISVIIILTRFACTFGAAGFTMLASRFITVADARPGWKGPVIIGWAGMRGVVSLAAALSIPIYLTGSEAFPFRNLILFITFVVILFTLVVQGLTLPWLIRKLNPEDRYRKITAEEQDLLIQKKMSWAALQLLETDHGEKAAQNHYLRNLTDRLKLDLRFFRSEEENVMEERTAVVNDFRHTYLLLLEAQRQLLYKMNHKDEFDEELIRKYLLLVDIEELKVREKLHEQ
ncbi:Na+/H+ antiporter [Sediminibacterium soli]|uniref:Na+/H+ antiporter n=1 Tax=Sediminibacterium soli TaxID=2698829 RepID=UPI00137AE423|nr:Na+/H+ antiporter [Sediminibacterium soli]NCI46093.1 Na+/H+ antiporter [Sediminibacterium soli]